MVCITPSDSLWLLLDDETYAAPSTWLNLETGEVRDMYRSKEDLLRFGWRIVEE